MMAKNTALMRLFVVIICVTGVLFYADLFYRYW